ncbi:Hydrogenase/urease nickel incorporation protein HypA [Hartmannibacter diazotrophicus]|uniref:Hydrogenase maturation factor HypA n=1 Tax=Hartmannibacter diazotrophicus TaxID=1482074 RepID=A0A2C9D2C8_9HYPH|nr:hydrogenase maturation nickel metallochaperone HypA [Hartmannibacter diazotrophicus]SON53951.1 Hydrogenase/urease nickel incorporation protein HypA [Hartmannibacter diazotrophicus]
MHEMSICESIVDALQASAVKEGFSRVTRVRLEIGCFGGVEVEALRFGFEVTTRGTLAEDAELEILERTGEAWCFDCSQSFAVTRRDADCPTCGGSMVTVTGGGELRIKDLEVI